MKKTKTRDPFWKKMMEETKPGAHGPKTKRDQSKKNRKLLELIFLILL